MKKFFTFLFLILTMQVIASPGKFAAPTTKPTNFTATSNDGDRISLSWTNGNGTKRIIVARKDAAPTFTPANGVNYGASLVFGNGNEVADGEFIVFNSNTSSATISGLQPSTHYFFTIFEYNGNGTSIEYLTVPTGADANTISAPTVQVTNVNATNVIGNSMKLNWTEPPAASGSSGRLILAREGSPVNVNPADLVNYTANLQFGLGSEIGSGNFVLAETSSTNATVTNLKPGTTYYFSFFEYKGSNGFVYNIVSPPTLAVTTLPRPTIASSYPTFSQVEGASMKISFNKGNGARRIVVAKAGSQIVSVPTDGTTYTANTVFGTPGTELGAGEYVVANGVVDNVSITGLSKATTYHFAVFEYDGTGAYSAYFAASPLRASQSTVSAPTVQTSDLQVIATTNNSISFSWAAGNGEKRMILMRKDAPVNSTPTDLTSYGYSAIFGSGSQIGSGNYCVYNNSGTSATITGLTAGSTYHVSVFEYNGSSTPVYLTANSPVQQATTLQTPTQISTAFQWSTIEGNRLTLNWSAGNGTHRIVVVKAGGAVTGAPLSGTIYNAQASFGNGDQIAAGEYVVMNSNSSQLTLLNLQPGTTYHVAVFEYNMSNGLPLYLATPARTNQTTVSVPTTNTSALVASNVTGNSIKLSWANGNGSKRIVIARAGAPVSVTPAMFTSYNDNPAFGLGSQIGAGNYVVYADNGGSFTLTGLANSTTYYFAVYEYNGNSYPAYYSGNALTGSQQTADRPTVASTNFILSSVEGNKLLVKWTKGTGTKRLVIARADSAVTATPQDGVEYISNDVFGNGAAVLPGQYAVQSSNEVEVTLSNLQPGKTYHFAVFEFDGSGINTHYLTNSFGTFNATTLSAPAGGPANVLFASIGATSAAINWTTAVADRHLVVLRKGSPVTALPQQLKPYQSSTTFGHSSTVMAPEHYVVYNSSGSAVNVTGLQAGTTYYVSVFAFNGNLGPVYNTNTIASSNFTTLGPPTDAASNVAANSAGAASATIHWQNGSGQKRLVLMRAGGPVTAQPSDAVVYPANSFFSSGHNFGNNTYAVYAGSAESVTVSNLQKDQVYYIAVFEYNQFSSGPMYLTSSFANGIFNGVVLPLKLISFNGIAKANSNLLEWSTAKEVNTSSFMVERSANGTVFETIGNVTASGNSNAIKNYRFEDNNRSPVSFYRLKMVDVNGNGEYSQLIRLQSKNEDRMKLFPGIAASSIQLVLPVAKKGEAAISIISESGVVMKKEMKAVEAGVVSTTIDVSKLIAGHYWLQVQMGSRTFTERFIKQ